MQLQFSENDRVVHPKHGLGCIGIMEERELCGETRRFLTVEFTRAALTLRIPESKLSNSGLRQVSSREAMRVALSALPRAPAKLDGHWSKRRLQLEAKLNSGNPCLLAELVRDLSSGRGAAGGRLYREALMRLAEELAAVEGIGTESAESIIEAQLASISPERKGP